MWQDGSGSGQTGYQVETGHQSKQTSQGWVDTFNPLFFVNNKNVNFDCNKTKKVNLCIWVLLSQLEKANLGLL